jgi:hypothetical protein
MSNAVDTPAERLAAYRRLSEHALGQTRRPRAVTLRFAAGACAAVEELARRESECCPFLEQRVELGDSEVAWTIAGPEPIVTAIASAAGRSAPAGRGRRSG